MTLGSVKSDKYHFLKELEEEGVIIWRFCKLVIFVSFFGDLAF